MTWYSNCAVLSSTSRISFSEISCDTHRQRDAHTRCTHTLSEISCDTWPLRLQRWWGGGVDLRDDVAQLLDVGGAVQHEPADGGVGVAHAVKQHVGVVQQVVVAEEALGQVLLQLAVEHLGMEAIWHTRCHDRARLGLAHAGSMTLRCGVGIVMGDKEARAAQHRGRWRPVYASSHRHREQPTGQGRAGQGFGGSTLVCDTYLLCSSLTRSGWMVFLMACSITVSHAPHA